MPPSKKDWSSFAATTDRGSKENRKTTSFGWTASGLGKTGARERSRTRLPPPSALHLLGPRFFQGHCTKQFSDGVRDEAQPRFFRVRTRGEFLEASMRGSLLRHRPSIGVGGKQSDGYDDQRRNAPVEDFPEVTTRMTFLGSVGTTIAGRAE